MEKDKSALYRLFEAHLNAATTGNDYMAIVQAEDEDEFTVLQDKGWCEKTTVIYKGVVITGWTLTLSGHIAYCQQQ